MVDKNKVLDINGLLNGEVKEVAFSCFVEMTDDVVKMVSPAKISGQVVDRASYIELHCNAEYSYKASCSRCLKDFDQTMNLTLTFPVAVSLENSDTDDYVIPQNGKIDLQEICEVNFFLNLPIRELCCETCKGLCPRCGADLNIVDCSCPKKDIDPRLKGFADFFN